MSTMADTAAVTTAAAHGKGASMARPTAQDAAFTAFMTEAAPRLERTAWLLTGNEHAAKELLQASLVKTYVARPRIREGEALAYTRRIMANENVSTWRRTRLEG